ncbi:MAG TPA: TonB-dependent receptor [Terriglobales bacterium]|nr:TonB-dependent receptor [Terriglobales bacterium]
MHLLRRVLFFSALFGSTFLAAQTAGSIQGTVTDSSGAVVDSATVTATNLNTNLARTATTNSSGFYSIPNLVPALYSVKFDKQGFTSVAINSATLTTAQVLTLNATLRVGSVKEVIEVNGAAVAPVGTESTQLSTLISNKTITDLPLLTRNPYELILLSPGTNLNVDFTGGISVNGSRDRNNNFLLDGVDNNDTSVPGGPTGVLAINPDSTQEFRVITNTFNAEYGRNTGAIIDVITRSGTNSFHGDAYEFGRYSGLGARDFFNAAPDAKNPYVRNQFGFSVGGPVIKNRTFFFINGEFQRFRTTLTNSTILPTAEFKSGLFTTNGQQIDVRTAIAPGNLTGLGLDPTIQRIFNLLPNPQSGNVLDGITGTYHFPSPDSLNGYNFVGKIDQKITEKHQLTLRYAYNNANESDPFHTEFAPNFDVLASPSYSHGAYVGLTSTLSNRLVNDFKFGLNRVFAGFTSNCASFLDPITGVDAEGFGRDFNSPDATLGVAPLNAIGCNTLFYASAQLRHTGTTSYADTLTWVKGNHTVKVGGDFRDVTSSGFDNFLSRDQLSFNRFTQFNGPAVALGTNVPSAQVAPIQDLIWMLVGGSVLQVQAQFFNKSGVRQTSDDKKFIQHEYDAFIQDSWKVRRNLTLSYGLRYQFDGVPFEQNGNFSNLFQNADSFASSLSFTLVGPGNAKRDMYKNDYTNLEPRVGIAWDPWGDGKTSVRAAYGIFHDRIFDNLFGNARGNPPFQGAINNLLNSPLPPANIPFAGAAPPGLTYTNGDYELATLLANNIRMPMSQSWNLGIQREIANGLVLEATYVGNHSTRVIRSLDAAPPDPALIPTEIGDCVTAGICQPGDAQGIVSGPALYDGVFDQNGNLVAPPSVRQTAIQVSGGLPNSITLTNASSNYNALQVQLQKTVSNGLQFALAYTWSHAIDNSNDPLNSVVSSFGTFPLDSRHADTVMRGNSDNDLRQRFTANFSYEFPLGRGKAYLSSGVLGKVLEGFQFSGIVTLQTGHPYTIFIPGIDTSRTGSSLATNGSWPNVVGDPYANSGPRITPSGVVTGASNAAAFLTPDFGSLGNAGRNGFWGPHYYNTDLALLKNFSITERFRFQFRAESFNLFNRPEFLQPANFVGSNNLGQSTSTLTHTDGTSSNRQIQLALKLFF